MDRKQEMREEKAKTIEEISQEKHIEEQKKDGEMEKETHACT